MGTDSVAEDGDWNVHQCHSHRSLRECRSLSAGIFLRRGVLSLHCRKMFALATLGVTGALLAKRQRRRAIDSRSFFVVSYNMLAESLGSNCIPWVMSLSEEWDERLKRNCPSGTWEKIKAHLGEEYRAHFHKNTHSQKNPDEYHLMRKLWSVIRKTA